MTAKEVGLLVRLYGQQSLAADQLAYTPEFENIMQELRALSGSTILGRLQDYHQVFTELIRLRKSGQLELKQKKPKVIHRSSFGINSKSREKSSE